MIHGTDRDMLVCSGYRIRGAANASLVCLIIMEVIACFLGVELAFIPLTICIIIFDIYCLFDPSSIAIIIETVLCLLRAAAASVYLTLLIIVLTEYSSNNILPTGYIQAGYTYSVLITASILWAIFIILNLCFSLTFWKFQKMLTLQEQRQATRNFQYAEQQMH